MSEYTELAKECGAFVKCNEIYEDNNPDNPSIGEYPTVEFGEIELDAFAEAIRRKTLQDAHTKLQEAGLGHAAGFYTLERLKAMAQEGVIK